MIGGAREFVSHLPQDPPWVRDQHGRKSASGPVLPGPGTLRNAMSCLSGSWDCASETCEIGRKVAAGTTPPSSAVTLRDASDTEPIRRELIPRRVCLAWSLRSLVVPGCPSRDTRTTTEGTIAWPA